MGENCRTCLTYSKIEHCVDVNLKILKHKSVLDLIQDWASLKVAKTDKLPSIICNNCYVTIKSFADFIALIRNSYNQFKHELCQDDYDRSIITQKNETKDSLERIKGVKEEPIKDTITTELDVSGFNKIEQYSKIDHYTLLKKPIKVTTSNNENFNGTHSTEMLKSPLTEKEKTATIQYKCRKCHKTFKKSYHYKMHMTVHTCERKFMCTICGKYFSKSYILIYHMRVHTGEKKFNCNICNKSFIHPSNLNKHRKIHTNTRNYKCEQCCKSFIQSEALKFHIRKVHTGEKPFLCEICSKSFSSQSALWVHKQDKHVKKESCTICTKQFSSRILKQHLERHKNKEENIKRCICEQCGKIFSSEHNLRQHLLSHKGIKPYASQPMPCSLCKKLYSKRRITNHSCIPLKN